MSSVTELLSDGIPVEKNQRVEINDDPETFDLLGDWVRKDLIYKNKSHGSLVKVAETFTVAQ